MPFCELYTSNSPPSYQDTTSISTPTKGLENIQTVQLLMHMRYSKASILIRHVQSTSTSTSPKSLSDPILILIFDLCILDSSQTSRNPPRSLACNMASSDRSSSTRWRTRFLHLRYSCRVLQSDTLQRRMRTRHPDRPTTSPRWR